MSVREEIMSLRKRLEELGELLPTLNSPAASPPSSHHHDSSTRPTQKRQRRISSIDRDGCELDGAAFNVEKQRDAEGSVRTLEEWAGQNTVGTNNTTLPLGGPGEQAEAWRLDAANPYWANPKHFHARVDLSREAAALFPPVIVIEELVDTFFIRCNHLCGHVLFEPRFRRLSQLSYKSNLTTEEILTSPLYVDPSCWAIMFMVLSISLCFYPYEHDNPTEAFHAVNEYRVTKGEEMTEKMHNISRRCLALHESLSFSSLPALQASALMIFRAREPDAYIRQLLRITISSAQSLGYHQLGNFDGSHERDLVCRARQESISRLWAYLCVRDWCSSERDGTYTIQPLQCTTRAPLNISDNEILEGRTESRPRNDLTETAYPLAMFSLAKIIREVQDARQLCGGTLDEESKDRFSKQFLRWLWALPPFFQLGATVGQPRIIIVQRWMLHHQAFHQLLKLCRGDLSSRSTRESILDLAHSVLITHTRVTSMCPVVKTMWVNWMHLWNAGLVVGYDLLDTQDEAERLAKRPMARNKMCGAIESIRKCSGSERGSKVLETLMEVEEERHQRRIASHAIEPINFRHLAVELIRSVAAKTAEPIWRASDFQYPSKAHDAILPALATSTMRSGHTDIIRVEDWRRVALESGLGAFEPVHDGYVQDPSKADANDMLRIVMASAPDFDASAFEAQQAAVNGANLGDLSDVLGNTDSLVTMATFGGPIMGLGNQIFEKGGSSFGMPRASSTVSETPAAFAPNYIGAGAVAVGLAGNGDESSRFASATNSHSESGPPSSTSNDNDQSESNTSISTPPSGSGNHHQQQQQQPSTQQHYLTPYDHSKAFNSHLPNGKSPLNRQMYISDEQQRLASEWGHVEKGEAFHLAQVNQVQQHRSQQQAQADQRPLYSQAAANLHQSDLRHPPPAPPTSFDTSHFPYEAHPYAYQPQQQQQQFYAPMYPPHQLNHAASAAFR